MRVVISKGLWLTDEPDGLPVVVDARGASYDAGSTVPGTEPGIDGRRMVSELVLGWVHFGAGTVADCDGGGLLVDRIDLIGLGFPVSMVHTI